MGGCAINSFEEKAFYLFVWRAFLVALVTVVLLVVRSFEFRGWLFIGGISALLFSLALVGYVWALSDERVAQVSPWRLMRPDDRPAGAGGRRWARKCLSDIALRFAEGASGTAIALLTSALLVTTSEQ